MKYVKKYINLVLSVWNKGFFHMLSGNFVFAIAAFGAQLLVADYLTESEMGSIRLFQSYIQILGVVAGFGLSTSVLVFCSESNDELQRGSFFSLALFLVVPISFVIWFLFYIGNLFEIWTKNEELINLFDSFAFIIILIAVTAVFTAYLQATRIFKRLAMLMLSAKISSLLLLVVLTSIFGLSGFINATWIGLTITLLIYLIFTFRTLRVKLSLQLNGILSRSLDALSMGFQGLGANFFGNLALHMDVIVLGRLMINDLALFGQYSFATIFITGMNIIQGTIIQVITPYISTFLNNSSELLRVYVRYSLLNVVFILLVGVLAFLTLPTIICYWYGDKYIESSYFIRYLLVAWFFRALNSINIAFLISTGRISINNKVNLFTFLVIGLSIYWAFSLYRSLILVALILVVVYFMLLIVTTIGN